MRKADLTKNHEKLDDTIDRYRSFMERMINAKRVIQSDQEKQDLAESVLLRLCANWDSFVDEHIVDCVNVAPSKLEDFLGVPVPDHPDKNLCTALIFGDSYRNFASFGELKRFTKKLLPDESNPFLKVKSTQIIKRIDEVYTIRNYLSHYSARSKRALHRMYESTYKRTNFIEPGQFLLAYDAKRLWTYFDAFKGASTKMNNWPVTSSNE